MKYRLLSLITILGFSTCVSAQKIPSYIPKDSLVGWFPFNGNANDESGNSNNGTVNGATLTSDRFGIPNRAYNFDGIDDFISGSFSNFPLGNSSRSISGWIYLNNSATSNTNFIISWGEGSSSNSSANQAFGVGVGDKLNYSMVWLSFGSSQNFNFSFSSKTNYFICVTVDQLLNCIFYVNGKIIGTGLLSNMNTIPNGNKFTIGKSTHTNTDGWAGYIDGKLDDIGVWKRALSSQEIKTLYEVQNCKLSITTEPQNRGCFSGNLDFTVSTNDTSAKYQWQTNQGTGWLNLSNAGQYNGVATSKLTVNNVTSSNDGQLFRCIANGDCGKDTTREAKLSVWGVGVDQMIKLRYSISPNPVKDILNVDGVKLMSEYTIYSVAGKQVLSGVYKVPVDIGLLSPGVYLLSINGQIARFIKE